MGGWCPFISSQRWPLNTARNYYHYPNLSDPSPYAPRYPGLFFLNGLDQLPCIPASYKNFSFLNPGELELDFEKNFLDNEDKKQKDKQTKLGKMIRKKVSEDEKTYLDHDIVELRKKIKKYDSEYIRKIQSGIQQTYIPSVMFLLST